VIALVVTVPAAHAELASDALWALGVRGVEERAPDGDTHGTVELWTHVGEGDDATRRVHEALRDRWPLRWVVVDDAAAETWRDHVRPVTVGDDVVIVPAWRDDLVVSAAAGTSLVVRIDPGGAFGLGDHPTTGLCVRVVRRLVTGPRDVLDVGCGSGVLAVVAAMTQPRTVRAVDISPAAVEATLANAVRNGVADRVVVDDAPLAVLAGPYDVVVANILAPTLVELADDLGRLTRPTGRLVISGILEGRHDHVVAALAPMEVESTDVDRGWVAVTLRHPLGET
jgi:ribosomal protein L11 methyltransferase